MARLVLACLSGCLAADCAPGRWAGVGLVQRKVEMQQSSAEAKGETCEETVYDNPQIGGGGIDGSWDDEIAGTENQFYSWQQCQQGCRDIGECVAWKFFNAWEQFIGCDLFKAPARACEGSGCTKSLYSPEMGGQSGNICRCDENGCSTTPTTTTTTTTPAFVLVGPSSSYTSCRGEDSTDESRAYYIDISRLSELECQNACKSNGRQCKGIEFSYGRSCRLFTRRGGIHSFGPSSGQGYRCFRWVHAPVWSSDISAEYTGGKDTVCRGSHPSDNKLSYFVLDSAPEMCDCQAKCENEPQCNGIEYHHASGRCELWTRPDGIGATRQSSGYSCLSFKALAAA